MLCGARRTTPSQHTRGVWWLSYRAEWTFWHMVRHRHIKFNRRLPEQRRTRTIVFIFIFNSAHKTHKMALKFQRDCNIDYYHCLFVHFVASKQLPATNKQKTTEFGLEQRVRAWWYDTHLIFTITIMNVANPLTPPPKWKSLGLPACLHHIMQIECKMKLQNKKKKIREEKQTRWHTKLFMSSIPPEHARACPLLPGAGCCCQCFGTVLPRCGCLVVDSPFLLVCVVCLGNLSTRSPVFSSFFFAALIIMHSPIKCTLRVCV